MYERNPLWNTDQPQQARHLPRPRLGRGPAPLPAPGRGRRRGRRELHASSHGQPRPRLRRAAGSEPAASSLLRSPASGRRARGATTRPSPSRPRRCRDWPSSTASAGGPPILNGASVTDAMVAAMGAFAIVAALERRAATGEGDYIDLSQIETLTTFIAGELVQATLTGTDPERGRQRPARPVPARPVPRAAGRPAGGHRRARRRRVAPSVRRARPCRSRLTIRSWRQRRAGSRTSNGVDAAVAAWTATRRRRRHSAASLQAAGIPAAVAVRGLGAGRRRSSVDREFYRILDRDEVGPIRIRGPVVRLSAHAGGDRAAGPAVRRAHRRGAAASVSA